MARFIYLTDTHLGAGREGYTQQSRCLEHFAALLEGLRAWSSRNKIDFILHGGDLTEDGTCGQIKKSIAAFQTLKIPFYLCLGNHDLAGLQSISLWLDHHQGAFADGTPSFALEIGAAVVFVMGHHWNNLVPAFYWDKNLPQIPLLDEEQKAKFERLLISTTKPVILAVHSALNVIPASQTGAGRDLHAPAKEFSGYFLGLAKKHANFKLALAAHNHVNTIWHYQHLTTVTTAAFTEAPFDFRIIEVDEKAIDIKTFSLNLDLGLEVEYQPGKKWVQGTENDRSCRIAF